MLFSSDTHRSIKLISKTQVFHTSCFTGRASCLCCDSTGSSQTCPSALRASGFQPSKKTGVYGATGPLSWELREQQHWISPQCTKTVIIFIQFLNQANANATFSLLNLLYSKTFIFTGAFNYFTKSKGIPSLYFYFIFNHQSYVPIRSDLFSSSCMCAYVGMCLYAYMYVYM